MWWKTFSAVFVAVLAAGLILFAVQKNDVVQDKAAATWQPQAKRWADRLDSVAWDYSHGDAAARLPETEVGSLRWKLKAAEECLALAPKRADVRELTGAITHAKEVLAAEK